MTDPKTPLDYPFLSIRKQFRDNSKNYVGEILRFYLEGKIHFENFSSLSFRPSQGHNSVNNGSNSASRDSFGKLRSRALIWHQD